MKNIESSVCIDNEKNIFNIHIKYPILNDEIISNSEGKLFYFESILDFKIEKAIIEHFYNCKIKGKELSKEEIESLVIHVLGKNMLRNITNLKPSFDSFIGAIQAL